ncbi:MAG TPA: L-threonylcarbamoyladenylate synthase [Candidatus Paceibacterota bacterium]|nr:L-threonylcarbamoyladenylate synthase [Candidatus Paceibacterota bacterium]
MRIIQIDLTKDYTAAIQEAVSILTQGGTVIYPTDTVYGIGCNALDELSVRRIFQIKQRSSKPLPILARNLKWVEELAYLNDMHRRLAERFWPGKFTLVLPKRDIIPPVVTTGLPSVGIRIADHPFTDALLGSFGYPLVATSANLSGDEATGDINKVIRVFSAPGMQRPDLVIDAGILPPSNPSVIIDCSTDKPKILRVGPSRPDELLKLMELEQFIQEAPAKK